MTAVQEANLIRVPISLGALSAKFIKAPLALSIFLVALCNPPTFSVAQGPPLPPPAAQLQSGDLIWPKKPDSVVPYNSQPGEAGQSARAQWLQDKETYLDRLRNSSSPTPDEKSRYLVLQSMTYEDFAATYLDDRLLGEPATFGAGGFYVGHVGIVEIAGGTPMIIEAIMGIGVRKISYAAWLKERPGELVWLGRLKDVPPEKREAVAKIASGYVGKPYNFWNFDLADTTSFYCSKLAWLSILSGAGFPPDDNPDPIRGLWYSPKQLMRSRHIVLVNFPSNY